MTEPIECIAVYSEPWAHLDLISILQDLKLLKVFHELQRGTLHLRVGLEEAGVVALKAKVKQVGLIFVGRRETADLALLIVRNHPAGKINSIAVLLKAKGLKASKRLELSSGERPGHMLQGRSGYFPSSLL